MSSVFIKLREKCRIVSGMGNKSQANNSGENEMDDSFLNISKWRTCLIKNNKMFSVLRNQSVAKQDFHI